MKTLGGRYLTSPELRAAGCGAVGDNVLVHDTCVLVGLEGLVFGNHVRVDPFCCLIAGNGHIRLGDYVHIAAYCFLSGGEGIVLEDFAGLSQGVRIYTRSDDYSGSSLTNPTVPRRYAKIAAAPVHLGRHVIAGSGAIILPGVRIAEGCAIGALSLVKSNLPEWGVYGGVPARRLRDRGRDLLDLEKQLRQEAH